MKLEHRYVCIREVYTDDGKFLGVIWPEGRTYRTLGIDGEYRVVATEAEGRLEFMRCYKRAEKTFN